VGGKRWAQSERWLQRIQKALSHGQPRRPPIRSASRVTLYEDEKYG
jgi:hypothetical protein